MQKMTSFRFWHAVGDIPDLAQQVKEGYKDCDERARTGSDYSITNVITFDLVASDRVISRS
jgi:hypothetical protein